MLSRGVGFPRAWHFISSPTATSLWRGRNFTSLTRSAFQQTNITLQTCGQPPLSAVNVTLPAYAAKRRAAAPLLLSDGACCTAPEARRRNYRSISLAPMALSSKPAGRRCCRRSTGQTDGRTPDRT